MKFLRSINRYFRDAGKSVIRNFSLSLASISCITITLIVVALSIVLSYNVEEMTKHVSGNISIVVFIKGEATEEEVTKVKTDIEKLDNFELNKELSIFDKTVVELTDYNKEIVFDDNEEEVFENLIKTNIDRLAIEKYYNDNATKFNKLLDKFPSSIISKFRDYSKKDLFNNKKEEIFEILKK